VAPPWLHWSAFRSIEPHALGVDSVRVIFVGADQDEIPQAVTTVILSP
jgi:hypothetical protein